MNPRPRIFGVLENDTQKYRRGFDEGSVDELFSVSTPVAHLERLWKIWLPPA